PSPSWRSGRAPRTLGGRPACQGRSPRRARRGTSTFRASRLLPPYRTRRTSASEPVRHAYALLSYLSISILPSRWLNAQPKAAIGADPGTSESLAKPCAHHPGASCTLVRVAPTGIDWDGRDPP